MLRLEGLTCGYGRMVAVRDLDLEVAEGEVVTLLGANGAGKSSTLRAILGQVAIFAGRIRLAGDDITALPGARRAAAGIALAPEGRRLFADLTVAENLAVGAFSRPAVAAAKRRAEVLKLFPRIGERLAQRAGSLSGGEQQMLAIGRALMAEPRLLMIDELSLGLMPKMVDLCYRAVAELKARGITILLVEQSTVRALGVADRAYVLESGRLVWQGAAADARADPRMIDAYLGLVREDTFV